MRLVYDEKARGGVALQALVYMACASVAPISRDLMNAIRLDQSFCDHNLEL